jgi:multiple sugar transport system permease protein
MTARAIVRRGPLAIAIVVILIVSMAPFFFMSITALQDATTVSLAFHLDRLNLGNFARLFNDYGFGSALLTSSIVVVIACVLNLVVGSLAAYAFEKKPFRGSEAIFLVYIVSMMVPVQVTLIPLFTIMKDLGLLNTHLGLALPMVNAFGVFLIRQFLVSLPDELLEAARLDGASELRIFVSIVLPLIRPVLVALTVFTFISTWNDFLWPLVSISQSQMQTVTLAAANLVGNLTQQYGLIMAGSTVSFVVPLVMYIFMQRQFVEGVTASGIKG